MPTQTPTPAVTIIGSRNITTTEYNALRTIAELFHNAGWVLRSGGAHGSDSTINDFSRVEIIIP
jgi:predicted Rossmann fold nucleotide-binding protein DprA/Smf involved in DNA uptake